MFWHLGKTFKIRVVITHTRLPGLYLTPTPTHLFAFFQTHNYFSVRMPTDLWYSSSVTLRFTELTPSTSPRPQRGRLPTKYCINVIKCPLHAISECSRSNCSFLNVPFAAVMVGREASTTTESRRAASRQVDKGKRNWLRQEERTATQRKKNEGQTQQRSQQGILIEKGERRKSLNKPHWCLPY